ncbi:MAG: M20/M25/M40 family metallo-hydrolase [Acidimicrobiaceae bacterium]|nr:M20/M25/M40 family metallo-hydrolase [Acidimicrobiaceae bacterium]
MSSFSIADFERTALATLLDYSKIPCLSPMYDAQWVQNGEIERATQLLAQWAMTRKIAELDVTIHRLDGRTPVIVVTIGTTAPGEGTVVLYGHLDKQPPLGDWSEGLAPFSPVRRGDQVFARGVADDGYAIFAALSAIEAMEAQGLAHSRCIVLIEASEESGSPDLEAHLDALHEHLGQVELMICLDSGALTYDRLWVTTSLRGVLNVEVKIEVLERALHSGVASGVVPSSFRILRQLLDRIDDPVTGELKISEFYAPIPQDHVDAALDTAEEFGDIVAADLPTIDGLTLMGSSAQDRILRRTWFPTLSIVGMGGIPEPAIAGNVLRTSTTAVLSLRLAPTVDARRAQAVLEETLTTDVPYGARVTLSSWNVGDGWVTPKLAPWLRSALDQASNDAFGRDAGFTGEGGSIPFLSALARRFPGVQFLATGVLGPNSNAHGIDEMLDLTMAVGVTNSVISVLGSFVSAKQSAP